MTERFVYKAGTISIANGASAVTGTLTAWGGHDWAGSEVWAILASGAAVRVGVVAEVDPRGDYDDLSLPLVSPYNGTTLSGENYELVDGAAIANGATQAAIFARYAAFIEGSAGLVFNLADITDYALVPNNSFVIDVDNNLIYQWRDGVLEPLGLTIITSRATVRAATTANITIATALNNGDSLDGLTLATDDRVLVKDQIAKSENGVYVVGATPARATDFDTYDEHAGVLISVTAGTTNAGKFFYGQNNAGGTLGTDDIVFVSLGQGGDLLAAQNLADLASPKTGYDNISVHGADVASAGTLNLETATGNLIDVTGTTAITAITLSEGHERTVRFTGALTLTNGASLVLPGGEDISTVAGDFAIFRGYASSVVRCVAYVRKDGRPLIAQAATIASASTTDLGSKIAQAITISGTTTITAFGSTAPTGVVKFVEFSGVLTLTHNGTSLILPGAANITTAAGDCLIGRHEGSGNWRVIDYTRADGRPLLVAASTIASASTTDLGSVRDWSITISGTTTIASFGSSAPTGAVKFVEFSGVLTLTHNGTSLILPGAKDIVTVAGDCLITRHEGSGNWRVSNYQRGAQIFNGTSREVLSAARTYYVRTDGSDSNNGLANTSGGAFLTIQKAIDTILNTLDLAGNDVTVQVGDGTYTGAVTVAKAPVGRGTLSLTGNTGTPANCIISTTSATCITVCNGAVLTLGGFKLQTTTSGSGITTTPQGGSGTVLITGAMEYGACDVHLDTGRQGKVVITANYTISGGGLVHVSAAQNSVVIASNRTVTISGTPNFSVAFAQANLLGSLNAQGMTFSGSATGVRYQLKSGGCINTNAGGASFFPGNSAGTDDGTGVYV